MKDCNVLMELIEKILKRREEDMQNMTVGVRV
jgi:hypothetical protein